MDLAIPGDNCTDNTVNEGQEADGVTEQASTEPKHYRCPLCMALLQLSIESQEEVIRLLPERNSPNEIASYVATHRDTLLQKLLTEARYMETCNGTQAPESFWVTLDQINAIDYYTTPDFHTHLALVPSPKSR